jgi:hypothetical protein
VKPQLNEIADKCVDFRYPFDSGIQQKLETDGFEVKWCLDSKASRTIDIEGWELVVEPDAKGIVSRFRVKDGPADQILIKRKIANQPLTGVTNIKRCLECGQSLYLQHRGLTTADSVWLCATPACPANRVR